MASTIASNSQKWIASQLSATAADARPPRTTWNYVRDCNGMILIQPVVGFYFNPPPNAKCRWSTDNGARPPQLLTRGSQLPQRTLILWDDEKLETEAAHFREKYWDEMKTLAAPQQFEDLYEYFDSATLYISGAVNLWNLINLLANDARHNWRVVEKQVATECNNWVLDWLDALPGASSNRESLVKWDQKSDILTSVTSQFDWDNDLKALDLVGQNFLRECFLFHFERLTGDKPKVARFNTHAVENKPMWVRNPMMAAVDATAKTSINPEDVRLPPSPIQALSTIPEESSAIKATMKPQGLTIDMGLAPKVPFQTVSAPATAIPRITVEPQPAKEAEDVLEKTDRKDKTEDDFLSNQDLADHIQTTARQLSSQSTPGERQDSMLDPPTNSIPPRAVSTTEVAGISQHAHRLQPTFPEKAGTLPRNMCGNKPPFRGQPRSPQGYGPNRQQTPAHMVAFSGKRSALQQRAPIGSLQQQHMMQAFDQPNNSMQPPPPGFTPPTLTKGMPSYPHGFPPPAKGLPMAVGMEPMLGLPGLDFQNQMPVRPPHMQQPQLSHPQAPPMCAPPQYMGQQNVGTPMYQPNGYIHQTRNQHGREKGNKKKRHDDRRDSANSNGSRNKVRDDPIHGPIYALESRRDSNTSAGRRLSKSDGSLAIDPKPLASDPAVKCRNQRHGEKFNTPAHYYLDCPCFRCVRSSRSLFVKHEKLEAERVQTALLKYLGGWGATQVVVGYDGTGSSVVFNSDHDAVRAMQDLCTRPNKGRNIPGLGKVNRIWYAWFSKHFTEPYDNPAGLPRGVLEAKGLRRRSSSTLSRDSNPYRNQLPNNTHFNTPSFGHGPFWPGEAGVPPNMVPIYSQPTQRTLWVPDSADQTRKPSNTEPEPKPKNGLDYLPVTYPKRPDGVTALKEDWRSKPPAEEVIENISGDEAAGAEISSSVSSQCARSIKVCLPNETGSSRSRSVSPHGENAANEKQTQRDSPESRKSSSQNGEQADRGGVQDLKVGTVAEEDAPVSSGYRKATAELAVPVEEFQPTFVVEQSQPIEKHSKKGLTSYSKVTSELTEATENFDVNTVIRHKPPRSPLPKEWMASSVPEPSNLQDRFGALSGALQMEALGQQVGAFAAEETSDAAVPESPQAEEAPTQKTKTKKNWNKGGKTKRAKSKASNSTSTSTSSSTTPVDDQSRGASRASTDRPASRISDSRTESAAGVTTQSPKASQPATKKKNNKSQRKRKQPSTAEPSAALAGQARTADSQDHARAASVKESPKKTSKTQHSGPETETQGQPAPEPVKSVDGPQSEAVVDEHDESKKSGSQIDAGGSTRVEKARSSQEPPVVFEVPVGKDQDNCSPESNLFPNQKFTIDKVKRESVIAPPPAMKESDVPYRQRSAMHLTSKDTRIALPLFPPNSKPSGGASVTSRGPRSKSDDPFTTVKCEVQSEDWLRDKAVKTPRQPSSEPASHQTSPTPSPKKKGDHQGARSRLNAAAKSFEPLSIPSSPAVSVVSVTTIPFHTKKPSLPGHKAPVEQRLVTPAEQVIDPTTVTQPYPPAKEKKRVDPAPDRGGKNVQKERAKPSDAASAAATSNTKKTAAQAASAASIASKLVDEEEFPTLAAAAVVPQRRASWAIKASVPAAGTVSGAATTASAPKVTVAAAAAPKPPATSPNNIKLGQRGDAPAPVGDNKQGAGVGEGEKTKAGNDQWTTVGSSKKSGGKKTGGGNNSRSASGKSGGGATGQAGRAGGQGTRGGKVPVGEERKGG